MSVELLSHYGNDLMVVNVAKVSYGKESKKFEEGEYRLLNYLAKHKHTSPFRHPHFQFRITCPIYVERQLFKHQVGWTANSISGRYVDFSDTYTSIDEWRKQSKSSKQGSDGIIDNQEDASNIQNSVIKLCKESYDKLILLGVSKEQARTILPLSLNTTFIWTGSLEGFIHLCQLRVSPTAQKETRDIVMQMLDLVKTIEGTPFKNSIEAFEL